MKKTILFITLIIVGLGISVLYFLMPARPGSDPEHLEGTVITLPAHPEISVVIHRNYGFDLGYTWAGYSENIKGTWFGKEIDSPRWAVSIDPKESFPANEEQNLFLIPFSVHDNLSAYVNDLPNNEDAPHLRELNGTPEDKMRYLGLFSWDKKSAMKYEDAIALGEDEFVRDIQKDGKGDFLITLASDNSLVLRVSDGKLQEVP